ncbi:carboxylating nicotinate-nucleotide diphosphorylase [Mycoplasmatota bacterium WC44]
MRSMIDKIISDAIKEDMPFGDATTDNLISDEDTIYGEFIAKEDGVLSGLEVAEQVFSKFKGVKISFNKKDGDTVKNKEIIATIEGKTKSILKGERLALNIMQRMSGIATTTKKYVDIIKEYECEILDTRKTTPNLRILEKMAVVHGGGTNHRFSLSDMVMIKDNHIKAAGGIKQAVTKIKENTTNIKVEIEVENLIQFKEATSQDVDIIMLDNMSNEMMKDAVRLNNGKKLEASGNVNLERLLGIAETGIDFISVGNLTHSYKSLDISLKLK